MNAKKIIKGIVGARCYGQVSPTLHISSVKCNGEVNERYA